jgi:hypothetical protein
MRDSSPTKLDPAGRGVSPKSISPWSLTLAARLRASHKQDFACDRSHRLPQRAPETQDKPVGQRRRPMPSSWLSRPCEARLTLPSRGGVTSAAISPRASGIVHTISDQGHRRPEAQPQHETPVRRCAAVDDTVAMPVTTC